MRIRRIILGPAGFKGLAIARGRGGVDRIKDKEGILQERINERTFGLLQTEGDFLSPVTLLEALSPVRNGLGDVLQGGMFSLPRGAIIETKGVLLARPIDADESGKIPSIPYVSETKTWGMAASTPKRDALAITATNVGSVLIDAKRAKVNCAAALAVTTDGPLTVTLADCPGATGTTVTHTYD